MNSNHELTINAIRQGELLLRKKTSAVLRAGVISLKAGTGSYRVKQVMHRFAKALGIEDNAHVTLTEISLTCYDEPFSCTMVKEIKQIGVDAYKIAEIDKFARHLKQKTESQTLKNIKRNLRRIENLKDLRSSFVNAFAAGFACAGFAFLLGCKIPEIIFSLIGGFAGQFVRKISIKRSLNQLIIIMFASVVAIVTYILCVYLVSLFTKYPSLFFTVYSHNYVCALLFVIPGFPIVTGGLDIAKLNFSAGIARLAYASAILISAISISWVFSYFTDIEPALFTATNISHTLLIVFRVIASFVGVFGFAIMFNSPISTAVQAALVGALCNTLRLEWISNTNIYPAIATCLACVLVGLIAKPLCERNNFAIPRIELTVSATIIMVPGTLLYRETYLLGISTYVPAEYLLNALLVILAIPMGLAIARFLTDKSWRKN